MNDYLDYGISVKVSQSLGSDEGTRWITPITGGIYYFGEDEVEEQVGKFEFFHVDLESASGDEMDPWYVLDHLSNTAPFMSLFTKVNGYLQFHPRICDKEEFIGFTANLLIGDRLEILPQHRGKGLTTAVFDEIVRLFGQGCSILAIKSFPLQLEVSFKDNLDKHNLNEWQKQMALSGLESATDSATASLTSYYESLGFECLNEDGVMFKIL